MPPYPSVFGMSDDDWQLIEQRRQAEPPLSKRRLKRLYIQALKEDKRINIWMLEQADEFLLQCAR